MEFSSDSEEEKAPAIRVNHLGMIIEAANHHENESEDFEESSDTSSNDSEEEINAKLKRISDGAANQMIKMSTAFRVMILDKACPVALVGLHEEQIQLT